MKITILDDYQDVVKTLDCFELLAHHDVSILNEIMEIHRTLRFKLSRWRQVP